MLIEEIIKCDKCGIIIDGKRERFHQSGDKELCIPCYEGRNNGFTYLDEFEIDPVMYLDENKEPFFPKKGDDLSDNIVTKIDDDEDLKYTAMWSVFQRCEQGGVDCISDHPTEDDTISFKAMLEGIARV